MGSKILIFGLKWRKQENGHNSPVLHLIMKTSALHFSSTFKVEENKVSLVHDSEVNLVSYGQ